MDKKRDCLKPLKFLAWSNNEYFFCLQIEQINQEYKIRALQFHPDKNAGDKEMEEKFQELNVSEFFWWNVKESMKCCVNFTTTVTLLQTENLTFSLVLNSLSLNI